MESNSFPPSTEGAEEALLIPSKGSPTEAAASVKQDVQVRAVSEAFPPEKSAKRKEDVMTNCSRSKKVKLSSEASLPTTTNGGEREDEAPPTKFLSRREANRIHAFKSRQRSKNLLQELQQLVTQYNYEKLELERQNAVLTAQVEVLQQQNMTLLQSHPPLFAPNVAPHWLPALLSAVSGATPPPQSPWNTAAAPAATSWMMHLLMAAAAHAPVPPVTWAAAPPREGTTTQEPQQQLQRAFQQAQEATPEKPTMHPV
jgi:hypothetical protein